MIGSSCKRNRFCMFDIHVNYQGLAHFLNLVIYIIHVFGVTKQPKLLCNWLKVLVISIYRYFPQDVLHHTYIASFILQAFTRNLFKILWVDVYNCKCFNLPTFNIYNNAHSFLNTNKKFTIMSNM